jgi:hypothetical protein
MYRLPHEIRDCLMAATAAFRNAKQAVALATFLGRFWSTPRRLGSAFPIDRRALANRVDLGLSEARIRGAIRLLETVGFLKRSVSSGSKHRPTNLGLLRKPILFQFGSEFGALFGAANRRARAKLSKSPKSKSSEAERVLMGETRKVGLQRTETPVPSQYLGKPGHSHAPGKQGASLEAALDRFRDAVLTDKRIQLAIRGGPTQPNRTEEISHGSRKGCEPVILRKLGG